MKAVFSTKYAWETSSVYSSINIRDLKHRPTTTGSEDDGRKHGTAHDRFVFHVSSGRESDRAAVRSKREFLGYNFIQWRSFKISSGRKFGIIHLFEWKAVLFFEWKVGIVGINSAYRTEISLSSIVQFTKFKRNRSWSSWKEDTKKSFDSLRSLFARFQLCWLALAGLTPWTTSSIQFSSSFTCRHLAGLYYRKTHSSPSGKSL